MASEKIDLDNLADVVEEILKEFLNTNFEVRQKALQKGAELLKQKLENVAPVGPTGDFQKSFYIEEYKDHKYVGNTKTVSGGGKEAIPLINLLEYSDKTQFMRRTFEESKEEIYNEVKKYIENGG